MSKQYGLILPKKSKDHPILPVSKAHSIFNEDSDSDSPEVSRPTGSQAVKKQDKLNQQKAIEEDPTVYQYDEIYDDMEKQKKESKLAKMDQEKKPKYINRLLVTAEKRKRENERRIERQVQKEREQEGEMYKDKESFITSAYKKKLEEMRKLEEEEKREEYLESIGDVRKQGNLDGFYRHLYDQKVNYEEKKELDIKQEIKEEAVSDSENGTSKRENGVYIDDNGDHSPVRSNSPQTVPTEVKMQKKSRDSDSSDGYQARKRKPTNIQISDQKEVKKKKIRNYRIRKDSDEESDKNEEIKMEHLPSNIDADSDFSIDSSDSENENVQKDPKKGTDEKQTETLNVEEQSENSKVDNDVPNDILDEKPKKEDIAVIKKPKIDIWKKRTVGEKYDEAVKRYFERKALREMGL